MPMVGIGSSAVMLEAISAGTHSRTTAKAPASATARASARRTPRPLDLVATEPANRLGRQADVPHHGDLRLDHGLDGRGHPLPPLELHGLAVRLLEDRAAGADGLASRDLVREERQIGHHERLRAARATISAW